MTGRPRHLEPAVAGSWYPADPGELRDRVQDWYRQPSIGDEDSGSAPGARAPRAVIVPHAGFDYSGKVAAAAFRRMEGLAPTRVVLIGPSHHEAFDGAVVPAAHRYRTPLGDIPFDLPALERLAASADIRRTDRPFLPEHSLELELPFLSVALKSGWELVPLLIGAGASKESVRGVAAALRHEVSPETLVVVSSDFTHFGRPFGYVPFSDDLPNRIRALDMGAIDAIRDRDADRLRDYIARTGATICGKDAIDILLCLPLLQSSIQATPQATEAPSANLVDYDCSGNQTGNWEASVSYASIAFAAPDQESTNA